MPLSRATAFRSTGPGFAILLLSLGGCASTQVAGFVDPDYTATTFRHPAVLVGASNLTIRQDIETDMVRKLRRLNIPAVASMDVCPPTRTFTPEERNARLLEQGVDGLIVIHIDEEGVERSWVPATLVSTTTRAGDTKTDLTGGYEMEEPYLRTTTRLIDTATGRTAWVAGSATEGSPYDTPGTVRDSYGIAILRSLVARNLLETDVPVESLEKPGGSNTVLGGKKGAKQ